MADMRHDVIDKSKWPDGPWLHEPDRKEWKHSGLHCLIVRVPSHGALCGYVAVPPGHPWHGKDYDSIHVDGVHGGLTFASKCFGRVCHVPATGEPDDVWWFGFDHAHYMDLCPGIGFSSDGVYRDIEYVTDGVNSLAAQLAAIKGDIANVPHLD